MTVIINGGIYNAIAEVVDQQGQMITGRTDIEMAITRLSDDFVLDWNDLTFKATGSVTTRRINMPELDATTNPGIYEYAVDLSTITNETNNDNYVVSIEAPAISFEANGSFRTSLQGTGEGTGNLGGFGDFTITITVETSGAIPIPSVDVKIKDATDTAVIARATTNASGIAIFNLDAATYKVHLTRTGYEFPGSPETLVVTVDAGVTYVGDLIVITPAVGAVVCNVTGNEYDENNQPVQGVIVRAVLEGDTNFVDADPSTHVMPETHQTTTDVNGAWSLELIRSSNITPAKGKDVSTYRFVFIGKKEISFERVVVPDQAQANFKDII